MNKKFKAPFFYGLFLAVIALIIWKFPEGAHGWTLWLGLAAAVPFSIWVIGNIMDW